MTSLHVRSISLPSRSHPLTVTIKEQLSKLKSSQSLSVGQKFSELKYLLEQVDDLLQLPISHQILSRGRQNQCIEDALNGFLPILDTCNTSRDFFSEMKETVRELESSLRRRKGESGLTVEVEAHMVSRKNLNKVINKSLRNLRRKNMKFTAASMVDNSDLVNVMIMLREVEEVSIAVFESVLSLISQPMPKSKASGWSVVSKLLQSKHISCEGEVETNEMDKIDKQLLVLKSSKGIKFEQVQNVLKGLKAIESSFQEVEEDLECVYRQLLKTRVSLLNILNN